MYILYIFVYTFIFPSWTLETHFFTTGNNITKAIFVYVYITHLYKNE